MQTNKPRNYNCLPAESVIGGNNDISALLISCLRAWHQPIESPVIRRFDEANSISQL